MNLVVNDEVINGLSIITLRCGNLNKSELFKLLTYELLYSHSTGSLLDSLNIELLSCKYYHNSRYCSPISQASTPYAKPPASIVLDRHNG
jgi:hypothetical protein